MSDARSKAGGVRLRLPATSANLGPGFDAAAVALDFYLEIEAEPAAEFSIAATGRDAERCARLEDNLILEIYKRLLREQGRPVVPLAIRMVNGIPLGMGCGSSAAGRLAAIALAITSASWAGARSEFLKRPARWKGIRTMQRPAGWADLWRRPAKGASVHVARVMPPADWRAIVVLPAEPLATSKARAVLPESYSRADVVANIQSVALLGLAFAQERGDLLRVAMRDRIHQPYRAPICPLLPRLLPLAGSNGILGVALSGAGPAVLVVVEGEGRLAEAFTAILAAVEVSPPPSLRVCRFVAEGASVEAIPAD